jgi:hypothetical protein
MPPSSMSPANVAAAKNAEAASVAKNFMMFLQK